MFGSYAIGEMILILQLRTGLPSQALSPHLPYRTYPVPDAMDLQQLLLCVQSIGEQKRPILGVGCTSPTGDMRERCCALGGRKFVEQKQEEQTPVFCSNTAPAPTPLAP
uniref:Uncharacterized protein n=1 Tax=Rhodosorus marinus TaxID=101924 RepID=A0A7S3E6C9_9RHOD